MHARRRRGADARVAYVRVHTAGTRERGAAELAYVPLRVDVHVLLVLLQIYLIFVDVLCESCIL